MKLKNWITTVSPLAARMQTYSREDFVGDLIAGIIVAIMLVPQGMAYAMLAGLPPQVGLYASIIPLVLYSLFGSSNYAAIGPVAMVSLLVMSGVGSLATPGSEKYIAHCLMLALLVGLFQIAMAAFRLGFLVNFISHPVLVGFTSAAAIVIGTSQLKHLLGVSVEQTEYPFQLIRASILATAKTNPATLSIGLASIAVLLFFNLGFQPLAKRCNLNNHLANNLSKLGPLVAVVVGSIVVGTIGLDKSASVGVVGEIPSGLPKLSMPALAWSHVAKLLPLALVITLVGYLESISVAKALAGRRREKIDANRELLALGAASVGAAFTSGYPVTGGFSRSLVGFSAGARTQFSALITAAIVAMCVAFFTPAFHFIPNTVLAAVIIVAVVNLIDFKTPLKLWQYSRADAIALILTFVAVLAVGIERGILVGVIATVLILMWKMSRPHVAEIGRMPCGNGFRNVRRYEVETTHGIFAFRVDASLTFANAPFVESYIIEKVAERPDVQQVLLVCNGINDIDDTGLEMLRAISTELAETRVGFAMSEVKGPVTDRMRRAGFDDSFMKESVFLTTNQAIESLSERCNELSADVATEHVRDSETSTLISEPEIASRI